MSNCTDCAAAVQQKIAAKAQDQDAERMAKKYADENQVAVALYRDERGQLCFVRADLAAGYPVISYISYHVL